jgi:hypothetical protein
MATCVYCHKTKGKRSCPGLGGLICPTCCGQHRVIQIACPSDCVYLGAHEGYQRERTAQTFLAQRARVLHGIKDQKVAALLQATEAMIYRHFADRAGTVDAEAIAGIEEIRRRLSPLALPESGRSAIGEALWKDLEPFIKEVDRQTAANTIDTYIELARSFSGEGLRSHRFLRGLFGLLEQYYPDMVKKIRITSPGRIIQA